MILTPEQVNVIETRNNRHMMGKENPARLHRTDIPALIASHRALEEQVKMLERYKTAVEYLDGLYTEGEYCALILGWSWENDYWYLDANDNHHEVSNRLAKYEPEEESECALINFLLRAADQQAALAEGDEG